MENKKLPNSSAVLVLGILSICFCAAWGIPGLAMGIIALILYKKDKAVYDTNPVAYEQSFKNSSAGKVCAIVGVSLSAITFIFILVYFIIIGTIFAGVIGTVNQAVEYNKNHRNDYYEPSYEELEDDSTFYTNDSSYFELGDSSTIN